MKDAFINTIFGESNLYYGIYFLFLGFLYITYNSTLAGIYMAFLLTDYVLFKNKKSSFNFNSTSENTGNAVITAIIVMALFVVATMGIMSIFQGLLQIKGSMFALFQQYSFTSLGMAAQNPIFANNIVITLISYTIIIGTIETRMMGRFLDVLKNLFNLDYNLKDFKTWAAFIAVTIGFIFLHLQAKGVTGIPLLLVGLFALVSCIMIAKFREFESATYFHWFNNAFAILGVRA